MTRAAAAGCGANATAKKEKDPLRAVPLADVRPFYPSFPFSLYGIFPASSRIFATFIAEKDRPASAGRHIPHRQECCQSSAARRGAPFFFQNHLPRRQKGASAGADPACPHGRAAAAVPHKNRKISTVEIPATPMLTPLMAPSSSPSSKIGRAHV